MLTERARARLAEMVDVDGDSIAAAAGEFGVGWHNRMGDAQKRQFVDAVVRASSTAGVAS